MFDLLGKNNHLNPYIILLTWTKTLSYGILNVQNIIISKHGFKVMLFTHRYYNISYVNIGFTTNVIVVNIIVHLYFCRTFGLTPLKFLCTGQNSFVKIPLFKKIETSTLIIFHVLLEIILDSFYGVNICVV